MCGSAAPFNQMSVIDRKGGTRSMPACSSGGSATYKALPLAQPKPGGFQSLPPSLDAIAANPFGFYVNVRDAKRAGRQNGAGRIRRSFPSFASSRVC